MSSSNKFTISHETFPLPGRAMTSDPELQKPYYVSAPAVPGAGIKAAVPAAVI